MLFRAIIHPLKTKKSILMSEIKFKPQKPFRHISEILSGKGSLSDKKKSLENILSEVPELSSAIDKNGRTIWHKCLGRSGFRFCPIADILFRFSPEHLTTADFQGNTPLSESAKEFDYINMGMILHHADSLQEEEILRIYDFIKSNSPASNKIRVLGILENRHPACLGKIIDEDILKKTIDNAKRRKWSPPTASDAEFVAFCVSKGAKFDMSGLIDKNLVHLDWSMVQSKVDSINLQKTHTANIKRRNSVI